MTSKHDAAQALLQVNKLSKHYGHVRETVHKVVDEVSFDVCAGQTLGVVGESGCGKSTLARTLMRLTPAHSGSVRFGNLDWISSSAAPARAQRQRMQMVFQDPFSSLNPKHRVGEIVREPLDVNHPELSKAERVQRVHELLDTVGLSAGDASKYPHEFSGGQRQRIAIARALSLKPQLLIADEPVSALDVSIQSQILNLLMSLCAQHDMAMLFISHDLSVIRHLSDKVAVMYFGRMVEIAPTHQLYSQPAHPYTQLLLWAIPGQQHREAARQAMPASSVADDELPDPSAPPIGCAFAKRCPHVLTRCTQEVPALRGAGTSQVACFLY